MSHRCQKISQEITSAINYEDQPNPAKIEKRLIEHVRTLYRPNDFGTAQNDPFALLPFKQIGSLALPGETYKLAFTPTLKRLFLSGRSQYVIAHCTS